MVVFCLGAVIGYIIGLFSAAFMAVQSDCNSVEKGFVKLCGDYYKIEKIKKENNNENQT